jgi:hypothetical protein
MQKRLIVVMILVLVGTSASVADDLCHTKARTIVARSIDAMKQAMELFGDLDFDALEVLNTRGTITIVESGAEIYVKKALSDALYHVRLRGSPDVLWAAAIKGFDCPTPVPSDPSSTKSTAKKTKRP